MKIQAIQHDFNEQGFYCVNDIYTQAEVDKLISIIEHSAGLNATFRRSKDLFAIRQFLKEVPEAVEVVFNTGMRQLISNLFGEDYFVVKSIYFDKPESSNWFVYYHQDLTISVDQRIDVPGFGPWTVKQNQYAVQPPLQVLNNSFTIRIHLDDTTAGNGALKVVPGSHLQGIVRNEYLDDIKHTEKICAVNRGGVMLMRPLLFHASDRTVNNQRRRVIHIEFNNADLPHGLQWSEKLLYN